MWWAIAIGLFSLGVVLADLLAYAILGRERTISRLLQRWSWDAHPLVMIAAGIVVGGLIVHFFGWEP